VHAYDIETRIINGIHTPMYVVLACHDYYYHFSGPDSVKKSIIFLHEQGSGVYYIHNINFDGCLIIEALSALNITFNLLMHDLNIYSISCSTFEFRCSYKLLPQSLYIIGVTLLGIVKLPFPYKMFLEQKNKKKIVSPEMFNNNDEFNRYCAIVGNNT